MNRIRESINMNRIKGIRRSAQRDALRLAREWRVVGRSIPNHSCMYVPVSPRRFPKANFSEQIRRRQLHTSPVQDSGLLFDSQFWETERALARERESARERERESERARERARARERESERERRVGRERGERENERVRDRESKRERERPLAPRGVGGDGGAACAPRTAAALAYTSDSCPSPRSPVAEPMHFMSMYVRCLELLI